MTEEEQALDDEQAEKIHQLQEPQEREGARWYWKLLAIIGTAGVIYAVTITAITTSQHSDEITATKTAVQQTHTLLKQVAKLQKQRDASSATIAKDATQIGTYAVNLQNAVNALASDVQGNHSESYQILQQLCEKTPGCIVPTTTTP